MGITVPCGIRAILPGTSGQAATGSAPENCAGPPTPTGIRCNTVTAYYGSALRNDGRGGLFWN
jgi:hypothetical protein